MSNVRVIDIGLFRDGGSIELSIHKDAQSDSATRHVWLETPFKGEPRALRIDGLEVNAKTTNDLITHLLADLEEWWLSLPLTQQELTTKIVQRANQDGPYDNPNAEICEAIELSYVLIVRDYVMKHYLR
jgi:hypothetical protein